MPDISKLPELSELFGVTIDHLLGRSSALVEKAIQGKLEELPVITVEELASTAPLLKSLRPTDCSFICTSHPI